MTLNVSELVGLSLSLCVREIAQGKVAYEDVTRIVANTLAETDADWEHVIDRYRETYWRDCADAAEEIAWRLLRDQKIDQPRKYGSDPHTICHGYWTVRL